MIAEVDGNSVQKIKLPDFILNSKVGLITNHLDELQAARQQLAMTTDEEPRRRLKLQIQDLKDKIEKIVAEMESRTGEVRDRLLLQLEVHHNLQLKKEGVFGSEPADLELEATKLRNAARLVSQKLENADCPLTPQQRYVLGI